MKIQLETITSAEQRSFSMMFNPRLSDLFFWHFHPEYEIVYIDNATGTRHVGEHISTYEGSDLVMIGSNIPHLNFDYGVTSDYRKVVLHLKKEFVEQHLVLIPELSALSTLFTQSRHGIAFPGADQHLFGERLFEMQRMAPLEQYLHLIELLQSLASLEHPQRLHDRPYERIYSDREQGRLRDIHAFVDKHYHEKIELDTIASVSNMTREAFCRYFKKVTTYTFVEFLNRYRISQAKRILLSGRNVSTACYQCGFESLSYFNRVFKAIAGESPRDFRKRHL